MAAVSFSIVALNLILAGIADTSDIRIDLNGNRFFSTTYLTDGCDRVKKIEEIEPLIRRILDRYQNAGFPFIRVKPRPDQATDGVTLEIEEGKRVVIDDLRFHIRGSSNRTALHRYLHFTPARYFSGREINRLRRRLAATGLYRDIAEMIIQDGDRYFLLFDLTEDRHDQFQAGASFDRTNINIAAELEALNLLGSLRRFQLRYQYQRLFDLLLADPVLAAPISIAGQASLATADSGRCTHLQLRLSAPLTAAVDFSLSSGREMVAYFDTMRSGYARTFVGAGLTQHFAFDPVQCTWNLDFGYLFRDQDRIRLELAAAMTAGWLRLQLRPHAILTRTDRYEYFDYARVGGARTVRGYLEDEIIAENLWWLNIEYRPWIFYPLADIARASGRWYYSIGVGLDLAMAPGQSSLVFAWPRNGSWRDVKVHIAFIREF